MKIIKVCAEAKRRSSCVQVLFFLIKVPVKCVLVLTRLPVRAKHADRGDGPSIATAYGRACDAKARGAGKNQAAAGDAARTLRRMSSASSGLASRPANSAQ
jgi:hypothetical protein